ncbi:hypothetical protein [Streptomyces sp. NPDC056549]|uniref:hypothetical protein n=1 Tax=Streptomyces sp. NPDC056549 TaxID=3345864 RepID=UPI0036AEA218
MLTKVLTLSARLRLKPHLEIAHISNHAPASLRRGLERRTPNAERRQDYANDLDADRS